MEPSNIENMPVGQIMNRWPETIAVFLDLGMHCIGCPVGGFHTLREAAFEHGLSLPALERAVATAIAEGLERS